MDDDKNYGSLGSLGAFGPRVQSPYLTFDPKVIANNESQYIFPDGAMNKHARGRFEMAFSQIGGSVFIGAALGGSSGIINGWKATSQSQLVGGQVLSSAVRRTQLLNYVIKSSSNMANAFGVVAVLYSAIDVGLSLVNESNDDLNTFLAGGATGMIYGGISTPRPKSETNAIVKLKPAQRMRRSLIGTVIGLGLSGCYLLLFNKDKYMK